MCVICELVLKRLAGYLVLNSNKKKKILLKRTHVVGNRICSLSLVFDIMEIAVYLPNNLVFYACECYKESVSESVTQKFPVNHINDCFSLGAYECDSEVPATQLTPFLPHRFLTA